MRYSGHPVWDVELSPLKALGIGDYFRMEAFNTGYLILSLLAGVFIIVHIWEEMSCTLVDEMKEEELQLEEDEKKRESLSKDGGVQTHTL